MPKKLIKCRLKNASNKLWRISRRRLSFENPQLTIEQSTKTLFNMKSVSIFFVGGLLLLSCTNQNLPKYNTLDRLRIMALVAQPPEVNPGATVTITPLVSDLQETIALTYSAFSCLDLGISFGAEPTCTGNPSTITLSSGTISTLNLAKAFTGVADTVSITIPDQQTMLGSRSAIQQFNGVAYIFEYVLQNSSGEEIRAIKRIAVSDTSKTNKNTNPTSADLLFNGAAVTTTMPLGITVSASVSFTGSPTESYTRMNSSGGLTSEAEEVITTWFITDGKMKFQRTLGLDANEYSTPAQNPTGRDSYLIGVSRDGRGGSGYIVKCFGSCI